MGIQVWRERSNTGGNRSSNEPVPALLADDEIDALNQFIDSAQPHATSAQTTATQNGDRPHFSTDPHKGDRPRFSTDPHAADGYATEKRGLSPISSVVLDSWDAILEAIHACQACELAQNCTQKVPGVGDRQADLLIVGEGPGHDEDIQGEPFVGRSGQLLDRMLAAIGISREQVYITNIVKCRPPNNRDPKVEEALHCRAYLDAQIAQISPKVILSVGRVSAHNLLGSSEPVGKLIRRMHTLPGTEIPVKVTYHPAYLLRNPSAKAIAWKDMKLLHQMLNE
ncbi:MAG: uracil-DNA glycosylase [Gammaproteobacteria bacterium]|nr:MAG: uracil-DNA glycosylase [Gammaproteobacteria bacterium]UCH39098.1 MAG: uracil-DNA glycosylase [Gammaproteobacteria bacterium]